MFTVLGEFFGLLFTLSGFFWLVGCCFQTRSKQQKLQSAALIGENNTETQTNEHFLLFAKLQRTATCDCVKYALKETGKAAFTRAVEQRSNCRPCCTVYISPWCHGGLDIISIYTFLIHTVLLDFIWSLEVKYCKPSHNFHKWEADSGTRDRIPAHQYLQNTTPLAEAANIPHQTPKQLFQWKQTFFTHTSKKTGLFTAIPKLLWDITIHDGSSS